ncbi:long-chain fatty acid--CoA ligase [Spirulina sp. CCNP1310]|uniref:AMP-dependent synthetase/ligase n=1 Tax=Spirulina sp. CCNP1310 TaxID=3110249 RepID=UPI002B1FE04B|nr:long-chain fatty acid--CoA ligase [Spirulina sp. CCNP1310]MEA5418430.1 long-chain fatty acid--CoA ligase [Spirulina sp. CCNP1310]
MHRSDYANAQSLSQVWAMTCEKHANIEALHDPHSKPPSKYTYRELQAAIEQFAAGLQALGLKPGDKIAQFSDNSPRWLIADQGVMLAGAANAVRSAQADRQELLYIYSDSDSVALIVQDWATLAKLRPEIEDLSITFVILLSDETPEDPGFEKCLDFSQLLALGADTPFTPVALTKNDLATLLYTSGTTGQPKGVMLTHGNLLHQVVATQSVIEPAAGDRVLSILPSWHSYERSVEYFLFANGCTQIYTNIRFFKEDLKNFKPHFMVGVPRLWESIYEGVQKSFREKSSGQQKLIHFFLGLSEKYIKAKRIATDCELLEPNPSGGDRTKAKIKAMVLKPFHGLGDRLVYHKVRAATGGCVKYFVSGGGSLARHIDLFYEILNVPLIVGYGLTETAPIATARSLDRNLRGSAGLPLPETEIRIVDPETRQTLPERQQGLVLIRGPQVMQGYYKKPEATAKVIDAEGWFDSGDLGMLTHGGHLVLTGRLKDTIVLTNGENIEPQPIEDVCVQSPYIDQMMLVGQDQKALGALIVPNLDALAKWVEGQQLNLTLPKLGEDARCDLDDPKIQALFSQELRERVRNRPGYRRDDQIAVFRLLLEPFSADNGMLTQTLKMRRPVITERYHAIIDGMFD